MTATLPGTPLPIPGNEVQTIFAPISGNPTIATPVINTDLSNGGEITGLDRAITNMSTNLSGTPTDDQQYMLKITDNGTSRAITWGTAFTAYNVALPTQTVAGQTLRVLLGWDSIVSKWYPLLVIGQTPRAATDKSLGVMQPYDDHLMTTAVAPGASNMHSCLVVAPRSGVLHDLTVWCGGVAAGNLMLGVSDTGQASNATRTRLATSTSVANPGVANAWWTPWDPSLTVIEGQQYEFWMQSDSATATYGRSNGANIAQSLLPANFLKPGNYLAPDRTVNPYRAWFLANTYGSFPVTQNDTGLTGDFGFMIMGRVV